MAAVSQKKPRNRTFLMVSQRDHISAAPGLKVAVVLSKDGGLFKPAQGTVREIGRGWYCIALTAGDTDTLGDLDYGCSAAGADPNDFQDQVVAG